jgi:hypothetical protein
LRCADQAIERFGAPRRPVDVCSLTDNARLIFLTRILVGVVKGAFTSAMKGDRS